MVTTFVVGLTAEILTRESLRRSLELRMNQVFEKLDIGRYRVIIDTDGDLMLYFDSSDQEVLSVDDRFDRANWALGFKAGWRMRDEEKL